MIRSNGLTLENAKIHARANMIFFSGCRLLAGLLSPQRASCQPFITANGADVYGPKLGISVFPGRFGLITITYADAPTLATHSPILTMSVVDVPKTFGALLIGGFFATL